MSNFPTQLRLKEMGDEDIYFAKRDRELLEALRRRRHQPEGWSCGPGSGSAGSSRSRGRGEAC
jgi:hypothetical protein